VTDWFEKARAMVERKQVRAAGLVATQGIRGGASREVLKRIADSGQHLHGVERPRVVNEGAAVHISIVGCDAVMRRGRTLNAQSWKQ